MRTIKNESELPTTDSDRAVWQGFIRLKSDPTILKDCGSGELFRREDGKNWKSPAYTREREFDLKDGIRVAKPWERLVATGAYCDDATYPYSEKAAA
jgi:hypothetical protein